MINYLFSRINKETGFTKKEKKYMQKDIKENSIITFISAYTKEKEKQKESIENKIKCFKQIGINFKKKYTIDEETNKKDALKYIKESNIIFLLGGAPHIQMQIINKNELQQELRKVPLIIGVSAGAMNQTKRVIYIDKFEENKLYDYEGLNYFETSIYPHYSQDLIKEIKEVSQKQPIIAIPDGSFIRIENDKVEYIGKKYYYK